MPEWVGRGRRPTKEQLVAGAPAPKQVDKIMVQVPAEEWKAYLIKEGSKGPMIAASSCSISALRR